jgi:hypothetical protein
MTTKLIPPGQVVVQTFGGVRRLARLLGCDASTVSRWSTTGRVPSGMQQQVLQLAWDHGHDLTAHDIVWGREATT